MTPHDSILAAKEYTAFDNGAAFIKSLDLWDAFLDGHVAALDDCDGKRHLVVPCFDPWDGRLVDCIALDPARPADVHLLTGQARLLGNPMFRHGTVRVHRYVSAWLRNTDDLCAVDITVLAELFCGTPRLTLECDHFGHGRAVRRAFEGVTGVVPKVVFNDTMKVAA